MKLLLSLGTLTGRSFLGIKTLKVYLYNPFKKPYAKFGNVRHLRLCGVKFVWVKRIKRIKRRP